MTENREQRIEVGKRNTNARKPLTSIAPSYHSVFSDLRFPFSVFCFLFSALYVFVVPLYADTQWKEEKGDHFIVYYATEGAKPRDILNRAEKAYRKVADDLGYARMDNFWQWDKRVKIFVHPEQAAFQKATGQPDWSHGMANYSNKEIHTIESTPKFLDSVLPHEITHLIFRDFVGFKGDVPLWMDEGVAQWEEDAKRQEAIRTMSSVLTAGYGMTLKNLMRTDIRKEQDPKKVSAFYIQAISLVDFLIKTYGAGSFTVFCRELRDGKDVESALRSAYAHSVSGLEDLEAKWVKSLMAPSGAS